MHLVLYLATAYRGSQGVKPRFLQPTYLTTGREPAVFPPVKRSGLTSLGALLVHDAVAALTALDGVLRLDQVVRSTVCVGRGGGGGSGYSSSSSSSRQCWFGKRPCGAESWLTTGISGRLSISR